MAQASLGYDVHTRRNALRLLRPSLAALNYQSQYRGNDLILHSNDGLIYTTSDNYTTFNKVQ